MADLRTKASRAKLPANPNGYADNLATGRALIWRKRTPAGAGKWILRTARPAGGYARQTLGTADDVAPADGKAILTYVQALEAALGRTNADPTRLSVKDALSDWAAAKNLTAGNAKQVTNNLSAARRIGDAFGKVTLQSITTRQIRDWMAVGAATRPGRATANRKLAILKAALSLAADLHGYEGTRAWTAAKKYPKAESFGKRMVILTEAEEADLIAAAEPDCARLLTALQMTGARFGEIANAVVGDLEGHNLRLSGKTGPRVITLSHDKARWFATNRDAGDPLVVRADGSAWPDGGQMKPIRRAVAAAGLDGRVTSYALRHGFISRALSRGVPAMAVAEHCGTSIEMIAASYAKFTPAQEQEWFA